MLKLIVCAVGGLVIGSGAHASEFWHFDGVNDVVFAKGGFADTSNPSNWDSITAGVAITRGDSQGLYNPVVDAGYTNAGPTGTLWFFGGTAQDVVDGTVLAGDFDEWQPAAGGPPNIPAMVGQDAVLYLIAEDTYIDIKFTGWGVGPGSGGSYSYERAVPTPGTLSLLGVAGFAAVRRKR